MSKVWAIPELSPNQKLVFLAICDNANDEGICYPSIDTLQSKTSISRPTIIKLIKELEEKSFLISINRSSKNGGRKSKLYLVFPIENYESLDSDWKDKFSQSKKGELYPQSKIPLPKNDTQSKSILPKPSIYNHHIYISMTQSEKDLFMEYLEIRKKKKLVTTNSIQDRLLKKYLEFGRNEEIIIKAINGGWSDFYELKKEVKQVEYKNERFV